MIMYPNYVITPQQSRLRAYIKAIIEELRQTGSEEGLKRCPINHPKILEYKGRILGGRSQVIDFADWTEFLFKEYGPRETCLSLGSGIGRVERYLIQIGFTQCFETIELNPRCNLTARNANSRIDAREGDLNFVELKPNTYDFILCHGVLHHLINLEHVLEQINRALKPDGVLLVYEYVGEARWQFSEARLSCLRKMFPQIKLRNIPLWKISGFESVRSDDLLGLIEAQFGKVRERSVNYGGVFFPLVTCNWRASQQRLKRILQLDAEVSQRGELRPCYHMGVYRKSKEVSARAIAWTDEQLKAKLLPALLVPQQLARIAYGLKHRVRLRTRVRSLLSHVQRPGSQLGPGNSEPGIGK